MLVPRLGWDDARHDFIAIGSIGASLIFLPAAVLDEWNRNGVLCIMHIPDSVKVPTCVSTISEQFSKTLSGQYPEGGASQNVINFDKTIKDLVGRLAEAGGGTTVLPNGIPVEVRNSNWIDVNEIIGYGEIVIPYAAVAERLAVSGKQLKVAVQGGVAAAKNERAKSTEGTPGKARKK